MMVSSLFYWNRLEFNLVILNEILNHRVMFDKKSN